MSVLRFAPTPDGGVRRLEDGERCMTAQARIVQRQTRTQGELHKLAGEYADASTEASREHVADEIRRLKYEAGLRVMLGHSPVSVPMPETTRTRKVIEGATFTGRYAANGEPIYVIPAGLRNHAEALAGRTLVRRWGRKPQTRLWSGTRFPDRLAPAHYESYDPTLGMSVREAMKPSY